MQSPAEYRRYAEECERIARGGLPQHRSLLLGIAEAWRKLAREAEQSHAYQGAAGIDKLINR